jgi:cellulose synthase operon protein C
VRRKISFVLAFCAALIAGVAHAADRGTAENALVAGVNAFLNSDMIDARAAMTDAIKADPAWPLPHAVMSTMLLAQGNGDTGEGEAKRAIELGIEPGRVAHLFAHAALLQGDPQRALQLAQNKKIMPRFAGYAARIRAKAFAALEDYGAAGREFDVALELNPNSAASWTDMGTFRMTVGNLAGAIEATANAIRISPRRVDALKQMGILVRGQFGLTAATIWFRRALDVAPTDIDAMRELAATLGDAGQTVEMLSVTRQILMIDPDNPYAYYLQAVLAARAKRYDLARSLIYRTADKLSGVPAVKLLNASLELQAGNSEQAIVLLQEIVAQQPTNLKAQRLLGAALWRAGDAKGTIKVLERTANRSDADSYTLSVIGRAYEADGRRGTAATYLDRAAQPVRGEALPFEMAGDLKRLAKASVGPSDNADFAVPYINKLVLDGQTGQALAVAEQLRQRNPGAPAAHVLVGDALMAQGKPAAAVKAYQNAANIKFNEPVALRLIDALGRSGDPASALRALDFFLAQNPRSVAGLLLAGDHFMATAQWDRAIGVLEGLRTRLGNRDAAVLSNLGWAWFNKGDIVKASDYSAAAYGMAPSNPAFADGYGWILYKSGRNREGGAALLEKAVTIAPAHPGLRFHLGQALVGLGRKQDAKTHLSFAAAAQDFPDHKKAALLLAGL